MLATLVAAPLAAAEVYIPVLDPAANAGSRSETELWVSNTSTTAAGSFTALYLAESSDGTQRPTPGTPQAIPAKRSFYVVSLGQDAKVGLEAVELAAGLTAEAHIVSTTTGGAVSVGRVPVISDLDKLAAGAKAELLALERDPARGRLAHLGIVNLARTTATCSVAFFRTDGSQVGQSAILAFKSLSLRYFPDALASIGVTSATGVRAEVSCDQTFYAFAAQYLSLDPQYYFITPSAVSAGSTPQPGACPTGAVCYDFPGIVHTSTLADPEHSIYLSPPVGSYSRLELHLEVQVNGFHPPADLAHGLLYLIRNKNKDMYANIFLQGPNSNKIVLRHGFGLTHTEKPKIIQGFTPTSGATYALDYVYDPAGKILVMTLSQGGQELVRMVDTPNVNRVQIDAGHKIRIGLSNSGTAAQEPPSIGWRYSNLKVRLFP